MQKCIISVPFLILYLLETQALFSANRACISFKQSLCFTKIEALFCSTHVLMTFSSQVSGPKPTATHFRPRGESISPAWWAYRASMVSIYAYHAEYLDLPARLKALNALPLVYSIFLLGMIFFAFSRYLLLSSRLQTKLKRLNPDNSVKFQLEVFGERVAPDS